MAYLNMTVLLSMVVTPHKNDQSSAEILAMCLLVATIAFFITEVLVK